MSDLQPMDGPVTIQLTFAEALVLSECLDRLNRAEHFARYVDMAEQTALWALDCTLEAWNPVIFSDDYARHLHEAKSHITRGLDQ